MRMIKTYEGMTMNCDVIATIQSVFMNIATGSISEMVDDSFDPDTLEFAVTAFTRQHMITGKPNATAAV